MNLKEKDSTLSSKDISSGLVSTEVDATIQIEEKLTKSDWDHMGTAQKIRYWKKKEDSIIKIENINMKRQIVYSRA